MKKMKGIVLATLICFIVTFVNPALIPTAHGDSNEYPLVTIDGYVTMFDEDEFFQEMAVHLYLFENDEFIDVDAVEYVNNGYYKFERNLAPGIYQLRLYSSYPNPLTRYVHVTSNAHSVDFEIPSLEGPSNLTLVDYNEEEGVISGLLIWNQYWEEYDGTVSYDVYFENAERVKIGEPIEIVAINFDRAQFNDTEVPAGATHIRLYEKESGLQTSAVTRVWDYPRHVPPNFKLVDRNPTHSAIHSEISGIDWELSFEGAEWEEQIAFYELVQLGSFFQGEAQMSEEILAIFPAGQSVYSLEFEPTSPLIFLMAIDHQGQSSFPFVIPFVDNHIDGDSMEELIEHEDVLAPPAATFMNEEASETSISGTIYWEAPTKSYPMQAYKIYFSNEQGAKIQSLGYNAVLGNALMSQTMEDDALVFPAIGAHQYTIPAGTEIPDGATHLLVTTITMLEEMNVESINGVLVPIFPPAPSPANVQFMDTDLDSNELRGTLSWEAPSLDTLGADRITGYAAYFINSEGEQLGQALGEVARSGNQASYEIELPLNTPIPTEAVQLAVFSVGQQGIFEEAYAAIAIFDATPNEAGPYYTEIREAILGRSEEKLSLKHIIPFIDSHPGDLTGSGQFDETDLIWLLEFIEPLTN